MEISAPLGSFHCSAGRPSLEKYVGPISMSFHGQSLGKFSSVRQAGITVSCAKTPETTASSKSNVVLNDIPNGSTKKHALRSATFPSAFEELVTEVCDETSIAELQLKVGDFEMHLKRSIGSTSAPIPAPPPPVPTEPVVQPAPSTSSPKAASSEKTNPFAGASIVVSSKLASLEASGVAGYKLVTSPTVGSFRRGRTVNEKTLPPVCKQGDIIKEGKVIGYIDQFGTQLPVKSDVAGEILKLLVDEGDAIGYGDPLVAILPSLS